MNQLTEIHLSNRSPLRYPGGKFRARKILASYISPSVTHVASPFIGGGSFELHLASNGIRVTGGDKFWLLANFWRVLLASPEQLMETINEYDGKVDAARFRELKLHLITAEATNAKAPILDIELAAKLFVVNRCSFSGTTLSGGYSKSAASDRFTASSIKRIGAFSNPYLEVITGDYKKMLDDLAPSVDLLFLDPPYLLQGAANSLYGVSGGYHKEFDHESFRDSVVSTGKPFLLTYNDCHEVRALWDNANIECASWSYGMNKTKISSEVIITNY